MATLNDIKDSNYLTKEDCEPAIQVTVSHCAEEDVSMANHPPRMKYVVYFTGHEKGMVLNLTNFQRIVSLCGREDTDHWQGVQFTLYNDPTVDFGGKLVGGIRVWVPQNAPPSVQPNQTPPPAQGPPVTQQPPQGQGSHQPPLTSTHVGDGPPPPNENDVPADLDQPMDEFDQFVEDRNNSGNQGPG